MSNPLLPTQVEIAGEVFYIKKMNALDAISAATDLVKMFGPAFTEFISSMDQDEKIDSERMKSALTAAFLQLDSPTMIRWINRLITREIVAIQKEDKAIKLENGARDVLEPDVILELLFEVGRINLVGPLVKVFNRISSAQGTAQIEVKQGRLAMN